MKNWNMYIKAFPTDLIGAHKWTHNNKATLCQQINLNIDMYAHIYNIYLCEYPLCINTHRFAVLFSETMTCHTINHQLMDYM